ncbi:MULTISPECIES: ABC transporter permease subunit [Halococcus]|uniref:ABC-2 type transporter n=1 Tax=Halococcus salifodinae DSM 8989 TaxID=1227456 RepID=M0N7K2_9EURY|nr:MULTISPECIES: ABC transporter permease subunit [Halococcus]EMA53513.1 ABC-2 type transporter [Halococcus salifodinae DSM 8989]
MGLAAVTKKEFQDAIRSYTLHGLIVLFVAMTGFWATIHWIPEMGDPVTGNLDTIALLNSMRQPALYLIPLVALVVGYKAVAGEREHGSIRLTLGLPNTRRDVFLGKVIGQTAVVSVAILFGYSTAALIALLTYDSFALDVFVVYTLLSMLYALVCISIAVSFSASTRSLQQAIIGAGAIYLVTLILWDSVLTLLITVFVNNPSQPESFPDWLILFSYMNPSTAFAQATRAVIPAAREITVFPLLGATLWNDWYGFIVMGLWILVPLTIGHLLFSRADIQ